MLHNHAFYPADTTRKERERRAMKMPIHPARDASKWAEAACWGFLTAMFFLLGYTALYAIAPLVAEWAK